jgi:hypothetical protein
MTSKSLPHHNNSFLSTLIVGEGVDDHGGPYRAALHTAVGEEPPGFLQLLTPCVNSKSDSGVLRMCCVVLWCVVLCCAVLCCVVLYCIVLCCVVLCCVVLCCIVLNVVFILTSYKYSNI